MNVIFWDTETNGLQKHHSVLSISAIKYFINIENDKINSEIIDKYERFYFRKAGEEIGKEAIDVNGLSDDVIEKRRGNVDYPINFCDDIKSFQSFCSDTRHFVGHNIYYDKQYINFWLANMFCTMLSNTKIIGLKKRDGRPKYPSLGETARFYGVELNENELHGSMYDLFITYRIFLKMLEHEKAKDIVLSFLAKK